MKPIGPLMKEVQVAQGNLMPVSRFLKANMRPTPNDM